MYKQKLKISFFVDISKFVILITKNNNYKYNDKYCSYNFYCPIEIIVIQ